MGKYLVVMLSEGGAEVEASLPHVCSRVDEAVEMLRQAQHDVLKMAKNFF
jgi:hypothetical protein